MSRHDHRSRGLYKDSEQGAIMGVCAGLAHYFDLNKTGVRIATVVSLLFMFWPTLIAYFAAGFLLRDRPLCYCGRRPSEQDFWREHSRHY